MMSITRCTGITLVAGLVACGGSAKGPAAPQDDAPKLFPTIAEQTWYRATATCGQGPYEIELPTAGARWGEDFELRLKTPRRVALQAVILVEDDEVARTTGVFDGNGQVSGKADNTRCVADARERLVIGRTGSGGGTGTPGTPGIRVPVGTPPPPAGTAQLDLDTSMVTVSTSVLTFTIRDRPRPGARIKLRFWSIEPNDLLDVSFGALRIEWRPNVAERDYEAHLSRLAAEDEARRLRLIEDERRREEAWRRNAELEEERRSRTRATVSVAVRVETAAELAARRSRQADELAAYRAEQAERQRRALEAEAKRLEAERRVAIAAALEIERRARRAAFCASHPEDRGCWGAGGRKVHLELEQRRRERTEYCATATEDARCWEPAEWSRRRTAWSSRVQVALAPPAQPEGPPPAPLPETTPPKLSANASWRPGYWHWIDGTWVWLAGMWRVPERDIVAELTTTAPAAPPAQKTETATVAPVRTAVWLPGFWQWDGAAWVWIAGSWQLAPEARVTWRVPEWRPRGNVHVLIPGGWIRIGGR